MRQTDRQKWRRLDQRERQKKEEIPSNLVLVFSFSFFLFFSISLFSFSLLTPTGDKKKEKEEETGSHHFLLFLELPGICYRKAGVTWQKV